MLEETPTQSSELSLRDYMDLLRRRRAIVLQTFMVVFVLGVAITFMAKPVYRTAARILVEGKTFNINTFDPGNPLSQLFTEDNGHDIATQIEVLQGDKVMSDAYRMADVPPGSSRLDVHEVGATDVIELVVESSTPTYAERLAKQLPTTYLGYVTGNRRSEIQNATTFTQKRLKEENDLLLEAEYKLDRFKTKNGITDAPTDRANRVTASAKAQAEVDNLHTQIQNSQIMINRMVAQRKLEPSTIKSTMQSTNPAILGLKSQIAALKVQDAQLSSLYKPEHAIRKALAAQTAELQAQLDHAPAYVMSEQISANGAVPTLDAKIAQTREELEVAQNGLKSAQDRLQRAQAGLGNFTSLERLQAELARDVDIHHSAVGLLQNSVEQLRMRETATHDPVLVIAPAGAAVQVAPKKVNNLIYASLIGLMLGLCFAFLQEFLDDRINSPEDARRIVGTPALGYVPMIENEESRLLNSSRGGGSVLESYRVLRSNVRFAAIDTMIRSILVTSTVPGEGKSVTAYNLAVSMALDGRSVILVDTDLRRPTMHEKAKLSQQPGLTNVLVGHTSFEDAIKESQIPGLRILTAGPLPPNPAELLNSQAMRQLHQTLKENADIVIFDSPPCLATADAQVLSAETDGVLYVVQFGEAKKSAVRHAVEMLRQARARVLGVVFNKIDLTAKRDAYYYGYYGYYGYYQTTQLEDGRPRRRRSTAEFEALLPKNQSADSSTQGTTAATLTSERTNEAVDEDREERS